MMAVDVDTTESFEAGKPHLLFDGDYGAWYDVASDGQGFV